MQYDSYSQEETHMVQAIVGANWDFREEQMQVIRS